MRWRARLKYLRERKQWQVASRRMVSRMRMRRPSIMYGWLISTARMQQRSVSHHRQGTGECGIIRHGSATEGLSHALQRAHGTILAYLDSYPSDTFPSNRCRQCCKDRLPARCIHRVDVYISPKYARCSVSACCWLLAGWRTGSRLAPYAHSPALAGLLAFSPCLPPAPPSRLHQQKALEGRKRRDRAWNFANRPASAFPHLPPAPATRPVQSRLHFTTLQPITALSAAMHKVAIHPSNRVRQSCARRA